MTGILYIMAAGVVFIVIATMLSYPRRRKRHGVSREEFIGAFEGTGIPTEIPGAVYGRYKAWTTSREFGVAPEDTYEHDLNEAEEDVDDDAS